MIKFIQKIKDYFELRKLDKEVDENINMWFNRTSEELLHHDSEIQKKYNNGISLLKNRLRNEVNSSGKTYDQYLTNKELLELAKDEDESRKQLRKTKESIYIYKGKDIKTDKDKINMVEKRIGHYDELHKRKKARDLLRKARSAYQNKDYELHKTLMKQWEKEYGTRY